jgi:hypothetical protein
MSNVRMIDISEMQAKLKRNWRILAAFGAAGFLWALVSLHLAAPIYAVEMTMTPVPATDEEGGSRRLAGLASLAGIDLSDTQSADVFKLYLESLNSRTVADQLASDKEFMHTLFASQWDEQTQRWKPPTPSAGDIVIGGIFSLLGFPRSSWRPPDGEAIQAYLNQNLTVTQDPRKEYVATVLLNTSDIPQGIEILRKLNQVADGMLRRNALLRSKQYIIYLTQELKVVSVTEQREALANSLITQEQHIMAASAGSEYAAAVFDAPHGSTTQIAPRPTSIYLRDIALLMILGAIFVISGKAVGDLLRGYAGQTKWRTRAERLPQFVRRALEL